MILSARELNESFPEQHVGSHLPTFPLGHSHLSHSILLVSKTFFPQTRLKCCVQTPGPDLQSAKQASNVLFKHTIVARHCVRLHSTVDAIDRYNFDAQKETSVCRCTLIANFTIRISPERQKSTVQFSRATTEKTAGSNIQRSRAYPRPCLIFRRPWMRASEAF